MEQKFKITGMTCAACSAGIQKTVNKMEGVKHADVSLMGECMTVDFDESAVSSEEIAEAVVKLGYGASVADGAADAAAETAPAREKKANSFGEEAKKLKLRFFISLGFLVPLMYLTMLHHMAGAPLPFFWDMHKSPENFALLQLLLTTPILFINFAFFKSGGRALIKRVPNMDTLVSLGSAVSYLYSVVVMFVMPFADAHELAANNLFFESAAMVLTLVTLGKWLEARSKSKTGEEVEKLLKLAPDSVTVERGGEQKTVRLAEVAVGDTVVVKQGDSIPVDGVILSGDSFVDKSAVTGESLPVEVRAGDFVTSASVNRGNVIKVRAEKVGEDTVLSKIIKMVREAGASKAPIEKTVDKIAGIFVPAVLGIAALTFAVWMILWGTGAAELNSNHPLAACIVEKAREEGVRFSAAEEFTYTPGKGARAAVRGEECLIGNRRLVAEGGVSAEEAEADAERLSSEGKTVLYFAAGGKLAALFAVADTIKEGSAEAVEGLKARGILPVMLTGDAEGAARAIAKQAGIEKVIAEVLPEDKLGAVVESKKSAVTAMAGDGINDSPALKEADVGIAMGNGTDVAIDSADVVLVGGDLRAVNSAVDLSKATVRNIKENLFWAFFYNLLCIPLAAGVLYAAGVMLTPMYGALAMSLSSVFVVANALRLMRFRPKNKKENAVNGEGENNMEKTLFIEGMSCSHCSARVENALNAIEGVEARVDLKKKRASVVTDVPDDVLVKAVEDAGYKVKKIK